MKRYIAFFVGLIPVLFAFLFVFGDPTKVIADSWPWYTVRSAGLIAGLLLVLLVIMGIGMVVGYTYRLFEPVKAWAIHRALGISFFIAMLIHLAALYFDKVIDFKTADILVPFVSDYQQNTLFGFSVGSLWIAFGIIAFYISLPVIYTSLFTIDKQQKVWRIVHYTSYALAPLVFFHTLHTGTDFTTPKARYTLITLGIIVLFGIFLRVLRRNKKVAAE